MQAPSGGTCRSSCRGRSLLVRRLNLHSDGHALDQFRRGPGRPDIDRGRGPRQRCREGSSSVHNSLSGRDLVRLGRRPRSSPTLPAGAGPSISRDGRTPSCASIPGGMSVAAGSEVREDGSGGARGVNEPDPRPASPQASGSSSTGAGGVSGRTSPSASRRVASVTIS